LARFVDQHGWSLKTNTALSLLGNPVLIMPATNPQTKLPACKWIAAAAASTRFDGPPEELATTLQLALEAHHDHVVLTHPKADDSASALLHSCLR
jgi:hypothetical protein